MSKKKIFWVVVLAILVLWLGFRFQRNLAIDACLDSGGRWDYTQQICEQ
jgi:hypothetical protein